MKNKILKIIILIISISTFISCNKTTNAKLNKFNVLFIAVDDLNDWTGPLKGYPGVRTPYLDKFQKNSVTFTNAECAAPACNPSRAAVMTGIAPHNSGVYNNSQRWRNSSQLKDILTLPQYLRKFGYKTMGSGKIFHGGFEDPDSWDEYWPSKTTFNGRPNDPMPKNLPVNGIPNTAHFDWGPLTNSTPEMADDKVTDWVISQLQKKQEKPFFLACGIFKPHLPWYVPKKYFDLYPLETIKLPNVKENDLDDIPLAGRKMARIKDHQNVIKYKQWKKAVQGYLASITFSDEMIGKVLNALSNSPYANNTIVVLWSDHGWHLGEKLSWRKFTLWEEATRNNLMVRLPFNKSNGQKCKVPVNLLDIYPTILEMLNIPKKSNLDGESFADLVEEPQKNVKRASVTTFGQGNSSVRSVRWRYTKYEDGSEELYDHLNDTNEWFNLANSSQYDSVKNSLKNYLPTDYENPVIK